MAKASALKERPYTERIMPTDLDELQYLARQWGAGDAVAIPASEVILDPRVRFKCMIPKCYMSGGCSHCPPHGYSLKAVREMLDAHDRAIFFRVKVPSRIIAAEGLGKVVADGVMDDKGNLFNLGAHYLLVFSIVKLIQKEARAMGYVSTCGFAAGNCRDALCHFQPNCMHLASGKCRHPEISSPSMESCAMDAFTMAARQGWDVYPIGGTCGPESVATGNLMGLVLLAPAGAEARAMPTTENRALAREVRREKPLERARREWKTLARSMEALNQGNAGANQLPNLIRERAVWLRFYKNLHALYGSWYQVLVKTRDLFSGRPKKKESSN